MNQKELEEVSELVRLCYAGIIDMAELTEYQKELIREYIYTDGRPITYERVEHQTRSSI